MYFTVLGWWDAKQEDGSVILNPSFTGKEDSEYYNFDIGFIKGEGFTILTLTLYFGNASEFSICCVSLH